MCFLTDQLGGLDSVADKLAMGWGRAAGALITYHHLVTLIEAVMDVMTHLAKGG